LELDPSAVGIEPSPELPRVFGLLMDTTYSNGTAAVVALADGTASLYTSSGGGLIGAGRFEPVRAAAVDLLRHVEGWLDLLGDDSSSTLPPIGHVTITALTYSGRRSVSATEDELVQSRHPAAPMFQAVHGVLAQMRRAAELSKYAKEARPDGTTRLMAASHAGDLVEIALLLDYGADIEARDARGYTPLMYAANAGQDDSVRLLVQRGADVDAADEQKSTPLMFAAQHDHVDVIRLLLAQGADPTARGDHGMTALDLARQNGHQRTAAILSAAPG
jgi:hypothetical protein